MKTSFQLPAGYIELCQVDLQKNFKHALLVNILGLIIFALGAVIGHLLFPLSTVQNTSGGMILNFIQLAVLLGGIFLYIVLHELVHGIFIKHYSGVKADYGFTGLYAYAGSRAYFKKNNYIVIALAPIVIWGIVLTIFLIFLPKHWFWPVYFIQLVNLSGAAGDLYVVWLFSRMPKDILIQDTGTAMTVYVPGDGTSGGRVHTK